MKKSILIISALFLSLQATAQWFSRYTDSTALVKDANQIIQQLAERVAKGDKNVDLFRNKAIKNTTPYLIVVDSITVNLPFWSEVIPPQKQFFAEVAGG